MTGSGSEPEGNDSQAAGAGGAVDIEDVMKVKRPFLDEEVQQELLVGAVQTFATPTVLTKVYTEKFKTHNSTIAPDEALVKLLEDDAEGGASADRMRLWTQRGAADFLKLATAINQAD
jgi:hypothetical protein